MLALYWFSLIVGGGILAVSTLGDLFGGHADVAGGHDLDMGGHDLDVGGHDLEAGDGVQGAGAAMGHAAAGAHGADSTPHAARILSLRTLTYFLFGFGATGLLLTASWAGFRPFPAFVASALVGATTGALSVAIFGWLRRTEAGATAGEASFVGLPARVVLPLAAGRSGRVVVRRGDREYELRARPFETEAGDSAGWGDVVIVDMRDGTAFVAPLESAQ